MGSNPAWYKHSLRIESKEWVNDWAHFDGFYQSLPTWHTEQSDWNVSISKIKKLFISIKWMSLLA